MKIGIMQPYLFPYIGYYQLINQVNCYVSCDDVQYIKGGWINRNNLLIKGDQKMFTFSVIKDSQSKNINERYYNSELIIKEFQALLRSLQCNYKQAPYYKEVICLLNTIFSFEDYNVSNFNLNSINKVCEYLKINTKIIKSSQIQKKEDLRCQEKVLEIVKELKGTTYINPIGGISLYSKSKFEEENINLLFIKTKVKEYKQFSEKFVPDLSIIDVLMHNSKDEIKELLNQYNLVTN